MEIGRTDTWEANLQTGTECFNHRLQRDRIVVQRTDFAHRINSYTVCGLCMVVEVEYDVERKIHGIKTEVTCSFFQMKATRCIDKVNIAKAAKVSH